MQNMAIYMVGYDLHEGEDYEDLIDTLKTYANWWHCLDSTWMIISDDDAAIIRDNLWRHMMQDDKLLVIQYSRPAAWHGFEGNCQDWLTTNL
jgi:hypothetical protein